MKKPVQISIPSPCHENWASMTTAEKGRFCASCQKVVHDFTQSSDREIVSVLAKENDACGRFKTNQLNRPLIIPKEKKPLWIAASAAIISFLSLGTSEVMAQTTVHTQQQPQKDKIVKEKDALPSIQSTTISGTVTDDTGLPLPGANVIIRGTQTGVQTDFDGKYSIEANKGDVLEFSFLGYKTESITIAESNNINLVFVESNIAIMGGPMFIEKTTFFGRVFRTIGNWFREEDVDVRYK